MPKELFAVVPESHKSRLLSEEEWRQLGICMSPGWWVPTLLHLPIIRYYYFIFFIAICSPNIV
jgi:hypothetical protein